jgi:hypothetical protein
VISKHKEKILENKTLQSVQNYTLKQNRAAIKKQSSNNTKNDKKNIVVRSVLKSSLDVSSRVFRDDL